MSLEAQNNGIDIYKEEILPGDSQGVLRHHFNSLMGIIRGSIGYENDPAFYKKAFITWVLPIANLKNELNKPKFKKDPTITEEKLDKLIKALEEKIKPEIRLPTQQDVDYLVDLFNQLFGKRSMTE